MTTVALIGNPNCGKTTLFNQLTGAQQKVGNWPGVTVSKKTGTYVGIKQTITVVDLPGVYALNVASSTGALDEKIACDYILQHEADVYINIVDATNLKRNLYLTMQLLEMQVSVIVVVNMLDIAQQRQMKVDLKSLSRLLGCPVLPMICTKGEGVSELKQMIETNVYSNNYVQATLPAVIEHVLMELSTKIRKIRPDIKISLRWLALRVLENDVLAKTLINEPSVIEEAAAYHRQILASEQEDSDILIADARYRLIGEIYQRCVIEGVVASKTWTAAIDRVVMNRWLGIPVFLLMMYLMFELSMNIGTLLQPLFNITATTLFIDGVNYLGQQWHWPTWLLVIFAQGMGLGVNTVVNFIPQIGLLFLFLSFLEDSGYMARAAFVMDRFMQAVGLPGKSFIPLIVGFGCNVPAIMATRSLENRRDRILTALMTPFMSCGARLAIFVVFGTAFFPKHAGAVIFGLYLLGIIVALLTGWIMQKTVLRGDAAPFILELPAYHCPHLKSILLLTWQRLRGFVLRAGMYIVPICMLVGTLNAIEFEKPVQVNKRHPSVLAQAGQAIVPLFQPMGVTQNNWPAAVGLLTGTLAKEVVVGTLNTLYTQEDLQQQAVHKFNLWGGLQLAISTTVAGFSQALSWERINPFTANEGEHNMTQSAMGTMSAEFASGVAAFAYLLFVLLYIPCVSTMTVIAREVGRGWAWFSTFWSLLVAYTVAVIFYQAASWVQHPLYSFNWITGLLLLQGLIFYSLQRYSRRMLNSEVRI